MQYEKLTHVEHILKRPDSYIGSVVPDVVDTWKLHDDKFERTQVTIAPGLVKIFDEILVNAIDQHTLHPKKVTRIDVSWDGDTVTVRNNGDGIPIKMHDKEKVWLPELIFGHLLTSSNYDDTKERTTGGRNGYGAKLTNVFSKDFTVRVVSGGKRYTQEWHNNMSQMSEPEIKDFKGASGVEVTFRADPSKFGGVHTEAFRTVITRRVWDTAAWCTKAHVYLNGTRINVHSFEAYAKMQEQQERIEHLQNDLKDAIKAYREMNK
jgi:DNA topoisomerase-2